MCLNQPLPSLRIYAASDNLMICKLIVHALRRIKINNKLLKISTRRKHYLYRDLQVRKNERHQCLCRAVGILISSWNLK